MGLNRRQYTKEQKEKIVQALLSGQTALELGKEHHISPRSDQPLEEAISGRGAGSKE